MDKAVIEQHFQGRYQEFFAKYLPAGLKKIGSDEYQGLCPFHADTKPSLSINGKTGSYFCHGCNKKGGFLHFYAKKHGLDDRQDFPKILAGIARDFSIPSSSVQKERPQLVKGYDYRDERGTLLFQVCRGEPKSFIQRKPNGNGGWEYKLDGVRRVPYRLQEIVKAPEVIIVEGEKDADNLAALGFAATTNPGGAGKWRKEYNESLAGKGAIIIPDNDEPGRQHGKAVAASLDGCAKYIKIIEIPDLPSGGDVSDFISHFKKPDEAVEALSRMIAEAPLYEPGPEDLPARTRTCAELLDRFTAKVEYLWRSHIARGMPHIINGREGEGKSTILLAMALEMLKEHREGFILWVASEGQISSTVKQAMELGLGNVPRFVFAEKKSGDYIFDFTTRDDVQAFESLMEQMSRRGPILAVMVDSIRGITPFADEDSKIGKVMHRINGIVCDRHGSALLYIDHHKKGKTEQDNPHHLLDKNAGSTSKTSAVRLVLSVLPVSRYKRIIREAKNNLGPKAPDLEAIKLQGRIVFKEPEELSDESLRGKAEEFLVDLFSKKAVYLAREVYEAGEKVGINSDALKYAKGVLSIKAIKQGESWLWKWPY